MPLGGSVAVLHDLTDSESIEKTRRDFIANVSHELRTPLTSIQGYAETLLDGVNSAETQRDFLEIIRKNASRMTRLTEDVLFPRQSCCVTRRITSAIIAPTPA
jgi:two-component system phosphate regulon sensor histidine kinase PhoR